MKNQYEYTINSTDDIRKAPAEGSAGAGPRLRVEDGAEAIRGAAASSGTEN
jgi:hypothetical protein|nr:MAG TPA: hypothetical protein [Caudoviricetes sp.]